MPSGAGTVSAMDVVYNLLLVLHLVGWAMVLGSVLVAFREPKVSPGALHGILGALVAGLAMVGLASADVAGPDPNDPKVAVKLVIALVVAFLVWRGTRKPAAVTAGYLGAIAVLTVANVAIAVFW